MNSNILLIEDDPHVIELIKACLEQENFNLTAAEDGEKGLELAKSKQFHLIILDIMLPKKDGWEVCRELSSNEFSDTPILILTAKSSETDKVLGLELGGDDYLVKPFSPRELIARIRAILRRMNKSRDSGKAKTINIRDISIDPARYKVFVNEKQVNFTPKEFELLYLLASEPGKIFSREHLLECIWEMDYMGGTRTVDEHIKKLRKKLKEYCDSDVIHTVYGIGYKFEVEE